MYFAFYFYECKGTKKAAKSFYNFCGFSFTFCRIDKYHFFGSSDINHLVISGLWWLGMMSGCAVSSYRMASISSADSVKSKRSRFCAMRSFLADLGMMMTPRCSR